LRKILSNHPISFWILLLGFGILYALISLVNHYNFRTYAFDLGIFNNSLYDYAHFQWDKCTVMEPGFNNVLSDHFNLIPILISPLYWLTGSYTFLILQIAGILWGAAGMYLLVYNHVKKEWAGLLAMVHFMTMWGIFSALAYDYHDNVMAAMFLPWFFLGIQTHRFRHAAIWFSLILISKENMAFWMIFVCIGMMVLYRHDRNRMKKLAIFSVGYDGNYAGSGRSGETLSALRLSGTRKLVRRSHNTFIYPTNSIDQIAVYQSLTRFALRWNQRRTLARGIAEWRTGTAVQTGIPADVDSNFRPEAFQ
jgi:Predicted membrane protein (DUF2079)